MLDDPTIIRISKLDAARRQLRTAIYLWFHDGDPVATHTLAYASYEIIHSVSKARGRNDTLIYDAQIVVPDRLPEWNAHIRKPGNFFKHADRDPHATLEFRPVLSEMFLLFAISGVEQSGEQLNEVECAFLYWLYFHSPGVLTDKGRELFVYNIPSNHLAQIRRLNKPDFFKMMTEVRRQTLRNRI